MSLLAGIAINLQFFNEIVEAIGVKKGTYNPETCKVPRTFGDPLSASNLGTRKVPLTLRDPLSASDLGTRKVPPTI